MPLDLEMHSMTDTNFAEMPGNFSGVKKGSPMYAYCSPTFENNSEKGLKQIQKKFCNDFKNLIYIVSPLAGSESFEEARSSKHYKVDRSL